jgi:membrane protein implicated in regulation of membrane protease activity
MMTLSQSAPEEIQSSHYSLLATMEVGGLIHILNILQLCPFLQVFGKLVFASISGWMMDSCGIDSVFLVFVALSVLTVPLLWSMPDMDTDKHKYNSRGNKHIKQ